MTIKFTVYSNAIPKGRPRFSKRGFVYTPKGTQKWETLVKVIAQGHRPPQLLDTPLRVELVFWVQRPKSRPKKCLYPDRRPDLDNLGKAVVDALEGIIFTNDSRIVDKILKKRYGTPRVEITISDMPKM